MKKEIILKPQKASVRLFDLLEKKKLIKTLKPSRSALETKTRTGAVSRFYTSNPKSGSHTLMCVGKRATEIKLSWHEDNEDFILLNPLDIKFKKLFLVLSVLKKKDFLKKFNSGALCAKDLIAAELEFNNPKLSFFTMLKNTVHCEITDNANGRHPVFFVSEPSKLKDFKLPSKLYNIHF